MRERAAHAREVAQAKGKLPGRPRNLDANQLAAARVALGPTPTSASLGASPPGGRVAARYAW
jgi:hypothetical protein